MKSNLLKRLFCVGMALLLLGSFLPGKAHAAEGTARLYVNGMDVLLSQTPSDVFGDGTVSFDGATGTLMLNGANLTTGLSQESYAENPRIFFTGDLTIYLRKDNFIQCGTTDVMGQPLRDNAIYGFGKLTIIAEEGATLTMDGMIDVGSYVQRSGTVTVIMRNDHSKITKWGMYLKGSMTMEGGTLTVSTTGKQRNGAIMLENEAITLPEGATLLEGDDEPGNEVSALWINRGLTCTTRDFIRISLPDIPEAPEGNDAAPPLEG